MNTRILVRLVVPTLETSFEIYVTTSRKIKDLLPLLIKGINDLGYDIETDDSYGIYNKTNGKKYDLNVEIEDTDIIDGTELILI